MSARATFFVRGRVQGVGFRWWTRARALERLRHTPALAALLRSDLVEN